LLTRAEARLLGVLLACFVAIIVSLAAPSSPISLQARPGYVLDGSLSIRSRTDAGLEALALRLNRTRYRPGDAMDFTLYWRALRFLPENYQVQVYLLNLADGTRWNKTDYRTPGEYPTRRWLTNRYLSDEYHFLLSPTMIPGEYQIAVEVFVCNPLCTPNNRLTFFDDTGSALGQVLVLPPTIVVQR